MKKKLFVAAIFAMVCFVFPSNVFGIDKTLAQGETVGGVVLGLTRNVGNWKNPRILVINHSTGQNYPKTEEQMRNLPVSTIIRVPDDMQNTREYEAENETLGQICEGYADESCVASLRVINQIENPQSPVSGTVFIPTAFTASETAPEEAEVAADEEEVEETPEETAREHAAAPGNEAIPGAPLPHEEQPVLSLLGLSPEQTAVTAAIMIIIIALAAVWLIARAVMAAAAWSKNGTVPAGLLRLPFLWDERRRKLELVAGHFRRRLDQAGINPRTLSMDMAKLAVVYKNNGGHEKGEDKTAGDIFQDMQRHYARCRPLVERFSRYDLRFLSSTELALYLPELGRLDLDANEQAQELEKLGKEFVKIFSFTSTDDVTPDPFQSEIEADVPRKLICITLRPNTETPTLLDNPQDVEYRTNKTIAQIRRDQKKILVLESHQPTDNGVEIILQKR